MPTTNTTSATSDAGKLKTPSIFMVASPTGERLIRAVLASAVRQYLFGEIKISKASGNEVAEVLGSGKSIEDITAAVTAQTAEVDPESTDGDIQ